MASPLKQTKEYQLILRPERFGGGTDPRQPLFGMLEQMARRADLQFEFDSDTGTAWSRSSDRYDTPERWLDTLGLSNSVEYSVMEGNPRSKIKLKANQWDPNLLGDPDDPGRLPVDPATKWEEAADIKFEQDFNAVGQKFALGCSIFCQDEEPVRFSRLEELACYYRRLDKLPGYAGGTLLERLDTSYREAVVDDIGMEVAGLGVKGSLGCRYKEGDTNPFKVEFSFRVQRPRKGWKPERLAAAYRLFVAMAMSDLHQPWDLIPRPRPPGLI